MEYLKLAVVGLIIGFVARMLMPGKQNMGWIMTAVLGIAGSFLANFVGSALNWYKAGDAAGWIAGVVGAIVLLVVYGMVKNKAADKQ
jgi:uncharacterized membrane protein YeaQ/YmgE (transglycosylase-associated protein family)